MSQCHIFPQRAMGNITYISMCICHHSFISLNSAGILSIAAKMSTQLSTMSRSENKDVNAAAFNMFTGHFVEFEQCVCSKN